MVWAAAVASATFCHKSLLLCADKYFVVFYCVEWKCVSSAAHLAFATAWRCFKRCDRWRVLVLRSLYLCQGTCCNPLTTGDTTHQSPRAIVHVWSVHRVSNRSRSRRNSFQAATLFKSFKPT